MNNKFIKSINSLLLKSINYIEKRRNIFFILSVMGAFGLIFILNYITPLIADDRYYVFGFGTNEHVNSIKDVIISQYAHYFGRNGRAIGHFFVQLFLMLGKPVFNIVNSAIYVCLTLLVYNFIGKRKKYDIILFLLINIGIWCFLPVFGQNILWLTGSCVYTWTFVIALFFLSFYNKELNKKEFIKDKFSILKSIFICILSVFAGWSAELTGFAAFLLAVFYITRIYKKFKKFKLWYFTGLLGVTIGYVFLMLAPGNFQRFSSDGIAGGGATIKYLLGNFIRNIYMSTLAWFPLLGLLIILTILVSSKKSNRKKQKNVTILSWGFAITAIISSFVLTVAEGGYSLRGVAPTVILLIISNLNMLTVIEFKNIPYKKIVAVGLLLASFYIGVQYTQTVIDSVKINNATKEREIYIEKQKKQGNYDLEVIKVQALYPHVALYGLEDLTIDKNYWANTWQSKYYNLNSIVGINEK